MRFTDEFSAAAFAAILSSTIISWILLGKLDLGMTLNGCLAGLVAVTAGCAFVSLSSALIIGFIAGILVVLSVIWFDHIKIDDPVGAISVHLINGVFGTLAVGLFAQDGIGGAYLLLMDCSIVVGFLYYFLNFTGIIATAFYVFLISLIFWFILKSTIGIRVSLYEEIQGLDIGEHGNTAYPEFLSRKPIYSAIGIGQGKGSSTVIKSIDEKENIK